jgi:protein-disulfide isomerase
MNTQKKQETQENKDEMSSEARAALLTRIELMDQELSSLKESVGVKQKTNKDTFATIVSILIAAVIVAGSIVYGAQTQTQKQKKEDAQKPVVADINAIRPVSSDDHIVGSINASVKVIEYSDPECPFCKRFHQTMTDIMKKYGAQGNVAWVYRHMPLETLHTKAFRESNAFECAVEQKGNDGFWKYANDLFSVTPSNDGLPIAELDAIATRTGLSLEVFKKCMTEMRYTKRITEDRDEAVRIGADGTPFSVVIAPDGTKKPIFGAQPFAEVDKIIAEALSKK